MNKLMILLSGTPDGKKNFDKIIKKECWTWNCNAKNFLSDLSRSFGWDGVTRDDKFYKFISEFLSLLNRNFNFERKYLDQKIKAFLDDESEVKTDRETQKEFSKFILIMHGVSKDLVEGLKQKYGVYKIYIARGKKEDWNNSTYIPESDSVLYEDDDTFEQEILNIVNKLTERG